MALAKSQDYELTETILTDGEIPVSHYINKITGIKVVVAYVECPIVKGDIVFATEAFDDDGLPHTLEHLVFLGSEDYPYKGVLDIIANKSYADGTNAYTAVDHTNYTVSTAGTEGFLNILPVYLDHLLYPTLTDSAYLTEVHHINGDGEDAGVVYCEMQARQNSGESRCCLEMLRHLYPGKCGYSSETGGLIENLRSSTNNIKVRDYHKKFYHSKNLCIVVTGPIKAEDIFKAIKPIDDKVVAKSQHKLDFERPWQSKVEPLQNSISRTIQYPSDTDDDGLISISWRGPEIVKNYRDLIAVSIMLDYLNDTPVSPIQRDFVECENPYCSSISHSLSENSTSFFHLDFESVSKQYFNECLGKLLALLKNIRDKREVIDMDRLKTILSRRIVQILSVSETSPHDIIINGAIGNFLYGVAGNMKERYQEISFLKQFEQLEESFWYDLLEKYFVGSESRYVCIIGEPSPSLMQTMSNQERTRLQEQKINLKDKLKKLSLELEEAKANNEKPAPESILKSFSTPSTENIIFHPIESSILDSSKNVPFKLQYDSIKTNFITVHALFDTSTALTKQERLFLPLFAQLLLESSIKRNDKIIPYETIVKELFADTVLHSTSIGLSSSCPYGTGSMSMLFDFAMQVERCKYERCVHWYKEVLFDTVFTSERIKTTATRMVSDIQQMKRSGSKVSGCVMTAATFQSNSNQWATNFMRQQKFLKKILNDLKTSEQDVVNKLVRLRDQLVQPENMLVHLALDKNKIDEDSIFKPWINLIPKERLEKCSKKKIDTDKIASCQSLVNLVDKPESMVIGLGSAESFYMQQLIKSISSIDDPDLVPLYVLLQYLTQAEGPLWRQLRGMGLSYSYSIYISPFEGLLVFLLHKSTLVVQAYEKAVEVVNSHIDGNEEFEDALFESAKSILIFGFIKREKSALGKSLQCLLSSLRNISPNYNRELISKTAQVTKDDLKRVGNKYLKCLFDETTAKRSVICCHPSKVEEIRIGFKDMKRDLVSIKFDEEAFINSLE